MEFLLDPNVAYVVLVAGIMLALMALVTPGTGLFEIGALFCLVTAGYAAYNLEINGWALMLLIVAVIPFLSVFRLKKFRTLLMLATILLIIAGSIFLFPGKDGNLIGVHPLLASVVSILSSGILWIATDRVLTALASPAAHDKSSLIGQVGEAKTKILDEGSVQVGGELWTARSEKAIPMGSRVRVIQREGFVLTVEKVE